MKITHSHYILVDSEGGLELHAPQEKKFKPLRIDFDQYKKSFRSPEADLLKRAIGKLTTDQGLLDVTMGFAQDSFRLATYGYKLWSVEKSKFAYLLVADALKRARSVNQDCLQNWTLLHSSSEDLSFDFFMKNHIHTIYADPMFPDKKSASGKELQILQDLSPGVETEIEKLIDWCFLSPAKKIVVKRPLKAPALHEKVSHVLKGRTIRWDIYVRS